MNTATKQTNVVELLNKFVNQKPGLDFSNYGERTSYFREMREITKDRLDYYELLSLASSRIDNLKDVLEKELSNSSGRLQLKDGSLQYCTGQYFPTEYRPAANRILSNLIFSNYRDEKENGEPVYKDGHEIRKAIKRRISRRLFKNYFN